MLVHSCYVDNGFGDHVDVLDSNGYFDTPFGSSQHCFSCGLDAVLLSTPDYDSTLRLATKAYHVFKYADRPVLQFQCQVTLCLKLDGGCVGITPPKCPETVASHAHTHNRFHKNKLRRSRRDLSIQRSAYDPSTTIDVFTKPLIVVDEQFAALADCPLLSPASSSSSSINFNRVNVWNSAILLALALMIAFNLTLITVGVWIWLRKKFVRKLDFTS